MLHLKLNPHKLAISTNIWLFPGQAVRLDNTVFTHIHLMSDFPITVRIGDCKATETTDIRCETMPNLYIHFRDARVGVPIHSVSPNHIYITASKD